MQHTWKILVIIFVAAIIGLGLFTANNPNLKARVDIFFKEIFTTTNGN